MTASPIQDDIRTPAMVQIGYVIKRKGLKGELKIYLETPLPENTKALFICQQNRPTPFFIERITASHNMAIVKLEEIDTPEEATKMAQKAIYLPKSAYNGVPEKKGRPKKLFIGYHVIHNAQNIGSVKDINEFAKNPLLIVTHNKKDVLIPLNDHFVKKIDNKKKRIIVNLPDGLLDL